MTNLEITSLHAVKESKRKLFLASIPQLHNTHLFTKYKGD